LHGYLIDLHVLLNHHLLEAFEVVDVEYLLYDPVVGGVGRAGLTGSLKCLSSDAHLSDELAKQFVYEAEKVLLTQKRQDDV